MTPGPPRPPVVIGIAGPSGSGKSALSLRLRDTLSASLIPLDAYYRPLDHLPADERANRNFDHPDAIESELLVQQVRALQQGHPVDRPCYDFVNHTRRTGETQRVEPNAFVIVEGILALHYRDLRALFDLAVYVKAPAGLCLTRRIRRDMRERGRTADSVREQFRSTAQPMAAQFVLPSAQNADLVVSGSQPLGVSLAAVLSALRTRHLLG